MGDCRIRFQIASQLLVLPLSSTTTSADAKDRADSTGTDLVAVVRTVSADTTVHDLLASTGLPHKNRGGGRSKTLVVVLDLVVQEAATVWDCTVHPATNITAQCISSNGVSEKPEPHSKTLFSAGWFPSGSLQILPADATQPVTVAADVYDDRQYHIAAADTASQKNAGSCNKHLQPAGRVKLVGTNEDNGAIPLPSQVLQSVTQRHGTTDEQQQQEAIAARKRRQQNRLRQQQAERERARRLEARIRKLREQRQRQQQQHPSGSNSKKKTVSEQVQRMLVKSRATGRTDLKPQDRVYLHCILWTAASDAQDEDDKEQQSTEQEDYRYFSNQDTVGRILASFEEDKSSSNNVLLSELLVAVASNKSSEPVEYRRLPVSLRLYEAIANSYLSGNVDTVVIRWYDASQEEPTTSIVENEKNDVDTDDVVMREADDVDSSDPTVVATGGAAGASDATDESLLGDYTHLSTALINMDKRDDSKKKKKQSSSADKVRQMQMKSKAKGDTKRVKMPDRFFVELIVAEDKGGSAAAAVSLENVGPVFLAKTDPLHRLLRDSVRSPSDSTLSSWELLVPIKRELNEGSYYSFRKIAAKDDRTAEVNWSDAERVGQIKCFDRILLRRFQAS